MRTFIVAISLFAGLAATPAFADEITSEGTLLKLKKLMLIWESARLIDMERRECRAMLKTAETDEKMLVAYRVFDERINGPTD